MAEDLIVRGIRLDSSKLKKGSQESKRELDKLEKSVEDVGKEADQAERKYRKFGNRMRTVAAAAGGLIGAFVALRTAQRAARAFFETTVELEKLQAQLKTVTGGAENAAAAFDMILDFAVKTPFEVQNLTEAFVNLRVRGMIPTVEQMTGIGNMASAFSRDIVELTNAIVSGANGMSRPLRAFGVDLEVSGDTAVASFQGTRREINLTTGELAVFVAEMGNTGRISTAMFDQMQTLNGAMSNLEDTISLLIKDIGDTGLTGELLDAVRAFEALITESDEFATSIGEGAAGGVRVFVSLLQGAKPIMEFWANWLANFGDQSRRLADPVTSALGGLSDPGQVGSLIEKSARERAKALRELQQAQAELARTPETVRRFQGGQIETTENPAFRAAQQRIADLQEQVWRRNIEIMEGSRRFREIVAPDAPQPLPTGTGAGGGEPEKLKGLAKVLDEARRGEREIKALRDALEGTSVEFDVNAAFASHYQSVLEGLISEGLTPADEAVQEAAANLDHWNQKQEEAEAASKALEEQEKRLTKAIQEMQTAREAAITEALKEQREEEIAAMEEQRAQAQRLADSFVDMGIAIATSSQSAGEAFSRFADQVIADMLRMAAQKFLIEPLLAGLFGGGGSHTSGGVEELAGLGGVFEQRAVGGSVSANDPVVVGERGPEVFFPNRSGAVAPNHRIGGGSGAPLIGSIGVTITGVVDEGSAEKVALKARRAIEGIILDVQGGPYGRGRN